MKRRSFSRHRRSGVSEVIGALLLIIVVVVAVTSLSVFLSQAETSAEARQAYITSVQDEDLQFAYTSLQPSNPGIQWQFVNASTVYYVLQISSTDVQLTPQDSSGTATTATLSGGTYSSISSGVTATFRSSPHETIAFGAGTGVFQPATWNNATITIRNLNTASSALHELKIGGNWMTKWEEVSTTGQPIASGNSSATPLTIAARGTISIFVDFTGLAFSYPRNASLGVEVLTSAGNTFQTSYSAPVAVVKASTTTENYQITSRDIITLDGSQSFSSDAAIQTYQWEVSIPVIPSGCSSNCCPISAFSTPFATPATYVTEYVSGETVEYTPESLFPSGLGADCIDGPILASLTVVDSNGFMATSQPIIIPADPNITPPASLSIASAATCSNMTGTGSVTVEVSNIFNQPSLGVATVGFSSGTVSLSVPSEQVSSSGGQVTYSYSCTTSTPGVLEVTSGTLPPLYITVP